MNHAYGEQLFTFFCEDRLLASVVSGNLGEWLGFESMLENKGELVQNERVNQGGGQSSIAMMG